MGVINIKRLSTREEADLLDHKFSEKYRWYQQGDYFRQCLEENVVYSPRILY